MLGFPSLYPRFLVFPSSCLSVRVWCRTCLSRAGGNSSKACLRRLHDDRLSRERQLQRGETEASPTKPSESLRSWARLVVYFPT